MKNIKYVANVFKWFDKINGNTYHSINLYDLNNNLVLSTGLCYGYGEHYLQTLKQHLIKLKLLEENKPLKEYIFFNINENCLKRDLKKI